MAMRKLHDAAMTGDVSTLMELLHEAPLLLHEIMVGVQIELESPLHIAAMLGHTEFVQEVLIRNKELAFELDRNGRSPLHLASAKGNVETVKIFLLKIKPCSVCELKDGSGRTPLHLAAIKGRDAVSKELIAAHPKSTRLLTDEGETILHLAVKHNRLQTLKVLVVCVDHVVELLNYKDSNGNTILHLDVDHKHVQVVKYLVGEEVEGLDINASNNKGCTPLDLLLQNRANCRNMETGELLQNMEMGELLRDNGATRGISDMRSHVPLAAVPKRSCSRQGDKVVSDDWVNNMRSALMVVASLIATVAFQAGLSPRGGVFQENGTITVSNMKLRYSIGNPIMEFYYPYEYAFYYGTNTIAFVVSVSIILLLISGFPLRRRMLMWFLMFMMWAAIVSLSLTYVIGSAKFLDSDLSLTPIYNIPNTFAPEPSPGDTISTSYYGISEVVYEFVYEIVFFGLVVLASLIVLGNVVRMVLWSIRKNVKVDKRSLSTSSTRDGSV